VAIFIKNLQVPIDEFNNIVDKWMSSLEQYSFEQLCVPPSPGHWSAGQLYLHLINDTNYYIEQISICLSNNDNADTAMTVAAKKIFLNNDFPDKLIIGNPANAHIPQPDSIGQLRQALTRLKEEMNDAAIQISKTPFKGKTKHPGFEYLDANEWLRLASMHFRHHLRQKKRIDDFLSNSC
jgi:hypothetical protein